MIDLRKTIVPKSDQLNSDDLIGGPITIKITKVFLAGDEQPVGLNYEGDNGKPFKPCKSMRRVLVNAWGSDGNAFVGRSLTLYRDESVKFGGFEVGGIRISHMSHIDKEIKMALTANRTTRKPFIVKPLVEILSDEDVAFLRSVAELKEKLTPIAEKGMKALEAAVTALTSVERAAVKAKLIDDLKKIASDADTRTMPKKDIF